MLETLKTTLNEFLFLQDVLAGVLVDLIHFLPKLLAGFLVLIMFYLFYRIVRYFTRRYLKRAEVSTSVINLITKVIKYVSLGLALVLVADQIGIKIIALISTLGVAGIALGLAAQQTLANFISGIIILVSKPFKEGDFVELEGVFGRVNGISLRSTRLLTVDNLLVDIPNRNIVETKVINHTFRETIRLRIGVSIAYKESISEAQTALLRLVQSDERFLDNPAPEVVVTDLAESSVNLELLVWIKNSDKEMAITYELRKRVKMALDEAGIQIPYPHQQVFIESLPTDGVKIAGK